MQIPMQICKSEKGELIMANITLYHDCRRIKQDGTAPIKIQVGHNGKNFLLPTGVSVAPEQWNDQAKQIKSGSNKTLINAKLIRMVAQVNDIVLRCELDGTISKMTTTELKNHITAMMNGTKPIDKNSFFERYNSYYESKVKEGTRIVYRNTLKRIIDYIGEEKVRQLRFEDITKEWLNNFNAFLAINSPSQNARNVHFRNIRAVFNDAIDDEITTHYPFRRFKIRPVPTRKRSLSVEELRTIFDYPCEEYQIFYRDVFKLIFTLIGINAVDLYGLTTIDKGRIEYTRAKTNKLYSIKVEPEAMEIINKYKGEKNLLCIADRWDDKNNFIRQTNKALRKIGKIERKGRGGKKVIEPLLPELTTYWARHTWATIASYLDIPKETIAQALGHGGNTVTDVYIDFDRRKIDEANRKVLDYVLYAKK